MIVYKMWASCNKNGKHKYAPLYCSDEGNLFNELARWGHLGPTSWRGPWTRENWTKPFGDVWPQNGLPVYYEGKKKRGGCSDIYGSFFAFSISAIEILDDYLDHQKGEFLPIKCNERDDLLIYRCLNCLDALDRKKSTRRKDSCGWDVVDKKSGILRHPDIDRFAFKEKVICDTTMFILPCHLDIGTFVTEKFVERFREKRLTGLGFRPYWSSERGPLCEGLLHEPLYDDFPTLNF